MWLSSHAPTRSQDYASWAPLGLRWAYLGRGGVYVTPPYWALCYRVVEGVAVSWGPRPIHQFLGGRIGSRAGHIHPRVAEHHWRHFAASTDRVEALSQHDLEELLSRVCVPRFEGQNMPGWVQRLVCP